MSRELFEHYATKEGLVPIVSHLVDWLRDGSFSDAISLLRKPVAQHDRTETAQSNTG